jgi:hypothetical protein
MAVANACIHGDTMALLSACQKLAKTNGQANIPTPTKIPMKIAAKALPK